MAGLLLARNCVRQSGRSERQWWPRGQCVRAFVSGQRAAPVDRLSACSCARWPDRTASPQAAAVAGARGRRSLARANRERYPADWPKLAPPGGREHCGANACAAVGQSTAILIAHKPTLLVVPVCGLPGTPTGNDQHKLTHRTERPDSGCFGRVRARACTQQFCAFVDASWRLCDLGASSRQRTLERPHCRNTNWLAS